MQCFVSVIVFRIASFPETDLCMFVLSPDRLSVCPSNCPEVV